MKTHRLRGFAMLRNLIHDLQKLEERSRKLHADRPDFKTKEAVSERDFVRMFGTKVRKVRYSGRADFVGLMVLGHSIGFLIVKDAKNRRKARLVNVDDNNRVILTNRYIGLRHNDSLTNLWRGLLNYVQ